VNFAKDIANPAFMPLFDGFPDVPQAAQLTEYVRRIRFTNAITGKRGVAFAFISPIKNMPGFGGDLFGSRHLFIPSNGHLAPAHPAAMQVTGGSWQLASDS
jgi:hypothetical protein